MRAAILLALAWLLGVAAPALAKPKVAVAPLAGDDNGKLEAIVIDAASGTATVTSTKVVGKTLRDLDITEPDNSGAAKRLRAKLGVDAVIYGKLSQDGSKHKIKLSVYTRGKKPDHFEIEYKLATSKAFHKQLHDELESRLAPDESASDDDDDHPPPKKHDDDDHPAKKHADDDHPAKKRTAARDDDSTDDDGGSVHKRGKHRKHADAERAPFTQPLAYADAGGAGFRRTLTYSARPGGGTPPRVGTGALALHLDAELYGAAVTDSTQGIGSAGVYVALDRTAGLSIGIPGAPQSSAIAEGCYVVGARYRFLFGQSSFAVGAAYWNQFYIADRSTLTAPMQLNMADTDYKAIAPGALLRLAASPKMALAFQLDIPLMFATGMITDGTHLGTASSIAVVVQAGLDYALGPHYGLHFGVLFDQVNMSFKAGSVASATDRTLGGTAAFALVY